METDEKHNLCEEDLEDGEIETDDENNEAPVKPTKPVKNIEESTNVVEKLPKPKNVAIPKAAATSNRKNDNTPANQQNASSARKPVEGKIIGF